MGKKDKGKKKGKGAEKTTLKTDKKLAAKQKKLLEKIGEVRSCVAPHSVRSQIQIFICRQFSGGYQWNRGHIGSEWAEANHCDRIGGAPTISTQQFLILLASGERRAYPVWRRVLQWPGVDGVQWTVLLQHREEWMETGHGTGRSGAEMCPSDGVRCQRWWPTLGTNLEMKWIANLCQIIVFHFSYSVENIRPRRRCNSIITKIYGYSVWPVANGKRLRHQMDRAPEVGIVWLRWRKNCTFLVGSTIRACRTSTTTTFGYFRWKRINGRRSKLQAQSYRHHVVLDAWQPHRTGKFWFGAVTVKRRWRRKSIGVLRTAICSPWCQTVSWNDWTRSRIIHLNLIWTFSSENDATGLQWKWSTVKPGGLRPAPRSGVTVTVAPNGRAYIFGGVLDTDEDEERLEGQFSNEMHALDLSTQVWRLIELSGKKEKKSKKDGNKSTADEQMEASEPNQVTSDGIFTMTVGAAKDVSTSKSHSNDSAANTPSPRMKPGLAICKGQLYLYGGELENGSKQYTLNDFYSLGKCIAL